ncbi:zinc-binding dehydrogenase [Micromonospora sp. STR1s_5]|nr:zinc-binding dehydrogenase [Micromonospora sp. STR1s_5]
MLHGTQQAGSLLQKGVLVTGSGPIGALAVAVARHFGAEEIVATDIVPEPLPVARRLGADRTIDISACPNDLAACAAGKDTFDVLFECSGNEAALRTALPTMRPGASVVQLGIAGARWPSLSTSWWPRNSRSRARIGSRTNSLSRPSSSARVGLT